MAAFDGSSRIFEMTYLASDAEVLIGGFTLAQWDVRWAHIPGGFTDPPRTLIGKSGLYRVMLNGEPIAIGKSSGGGGSDLKKRIP
ncbi:hypothetical protein [Sphingomonas sp. LR55]|uniref:hypothetical protein n=1 Tax=Sphingomonas sp. LR55 TaxID=3050231 RepID=UPI002FE37B76